MLKFLFIFVYAVLHGAFSCVMPRTLPIHLRSHITEEKWNFFRNMQIEQLHRNGGCPPVSLPVCLIRQHYATVN